MSWDGLSDELLNISGWAHRVLKDNDIQDTAPYLTAENLESLNSKVSIARVPLRTFSGMLPRSGGKRSSMTERRALFKDFQKERKITNHDGIVAAAFIIHFITQIEQMLELDSFPWSCSKTTSIDSDTVAKAMQTMLFISLTHGLIKQKDDVRICAVDDGAKHHDSSRQAFKVAYRNKRGNNPNDTIPRSRIIGDLFGRPEWREVAHSTLETWAKDADNADGFIRKGGRPKKGQ